MPRVSVIIPVYNGERYIEEAIESVLAQTFRDFELIVVNDGSTDGTQQGLEKYHDRISVISQQNRGLPAARESGLRTARSPLVAFLDSDDTWLPRKLERQVEFAEAHPEYGIVTTDQLSFTDTGVICQSIKEWYRVYNGYILEKLLFGNWISSSAAMVRRECFEKVHTFGLERPAYGEDWLMWMQIAAYFPAYFIDEVLVRRRVHPNSMSSQGGEIQFRCLFRNLEIVRELIPELRARPELIREVYFRLCFRRGLKDLRALELRNARDKLRRAVGYKPYAVGGWAFLAASYVPARILRGVKQIVKGWRQLRFG